MESKTAKNKNIWADLYNTTDFGNIYPTESMISIYHNIIKPKLTRNTNKVLDFGCSIGANTRVFADLGFDVYGIDISQKAIDVCVERNGFDKTHFVCADILEKNHSIKELFQCKFDLIISLNCLYYFSDEKLFKVQKQFEEVMGKDSFLHANMHTENTYFLSKFRQEKNEHGMLAVKQNGNVDIGMYYNVALSKEDVAQKFNVFQAKHILRNYIELNGVIESLNFIGQKK